jgi:uncharacterized protein (DUF305 family)
MALLVAAAIGLGVGVWLARPHYPGDSSPEAGFARDMATHHAQAVAMGLLEYRNGGDEGLRGIGYDIANTQQAQIGMMNAWLREWDLSLTTTETPMAWVEGHEAHLVDGLMPGVATKDEMQQMRTLTGRDLDILFCHLMIDHHIGGIHMVDAILAQSDDTEVTRLAQGMKDAQQYEIDTLEQKLRDLGAA